MFQANSKIPGFLQVTTSILIVALLCLSVYYLIYIGNRYVTNDRKINLNWRNIFKIIGYLILLSIISALFGAYPILGSTLFSIFVAILLAYLLNPLINKMESKGIKRSIGTIIVYAILVLMFVGLGFLVIPSLTEQISNFVTNLPEITSYMLDWFNETFAKSKLSNNELFAQAEEIVKNFIGNYSSKILSWSADAFTTLTGSLRKVLTIILIPIITYFLLVDKDRIFASIKKVYPKEHYDDSKELFDEVNVAMNGFVRGRIIMAIFVGVVTMLYLLLLKIDFAVVIGFITMIGDIIPYIGPALGFIPAFIFAFIHSPAKALWVGLIFVFVQWLENNLLGPKLIGDSTGLHPLIVLLSIIVGGGMFGVWGMILSVPFVSLVIILVKFYNKNKNEQKDIDLKQ